MKRLVLNYVVGLMVFLFMDSIWLTVIAQQMYQEQLGPVINLKFKLTAAVVFYALYVAGIVFFAVLPGLTERSWKKGLINGSLLGGLCYATYDMTNLATIEGWPVFVTIIDIIWGMFITGVTAALTIIVYGKYFNSP